jgi:hypothetical protein
MGNLTTVSEEERRIAQELMRQLQGATAPEPGEQDLAAQLMQQLQGTGQPQQPSIPEGAELIGTFADNGRVYRMPDGSLGAASAGGATRDPETVSRIMQGDTFARVMQDTLDQERIAQNPVAAVGNEIIRGAPFIGSYADEAVGMFSPQAAENMRATTEAMQRQRPGLTTSMNVLGGIGFGAPMAVAAAPGIVANAPATIGGRAVAGLGAGAALGATEGAIYGAGEGTTGQERMSNALTGGMIGGAAGGALGVALPYLGAGVSNVLGRVRNTDVGAVMGALGVSRPAATIVRDALRTGDMAGSEAALARGGDAAMLADAGIPARQLLDAAAQAGGPASRIANEAIAARTQEATRQLTGALDQTLGAPRGEQAIMRDIQAASRPLRNEAYDLAYSRPIDYTSEAGRNIEGLLERLPRQTALRAIAEANDRIRFDGSPANQIMARIGDDGSVTYQEMPNVMQLDYIKRAFDNIARDGRDPITGKMSSEGAFAQRIAREIRDATREAVPEYGRALEVAGDALSIENAAQIGRNILNMTREEVARELGNATAPERRAAQEGLRSYIDDVTARVTRTMGNPDTETREGIRILRDLSSRQNETNLRVLLGQREAEKLLREVDEAATAFELRSAIAAGSQTAIRQSIQSGVDAQASEGIVRTLASGEPVNAVRRLTQALTGETAEARELRRMGLYAEIATALTEQRGPRAQQALAVINHAINREATLTAAQSQLVADVLTSVYAGGVRTTGVLTDDRAARPPR